MLLQTHIFGAEVTVNDTIALQRLLEIMLYSKIFSRNFLNSINILDMRFRLKQIY
jgi:hypothetical protein